MSRRKKFLICAAGVTLVVGVFWSTAFFNEPKYKGRTISSWFEEIEIKDGKSDLSEKAKGAIRYIGTNHLELFVERLAYEPPAWTTSSNVSSLYQYKWFNWLVNKLVQEKSADAQRAGAMFSILGSNAAPAVPRLARILEQRNDSAVEMRSAGALVMIGDPAEAAVLQIMKNPQHRAFESVSKAIGYWNEGQNFSAVIPHLLAATTNADPVKVERAIEGLGGIRTEPERTIPPLINALSSPNENVRVAAMISLGRYESQASDAVAILQRILSDPNRSEMEKGYAESTLRWIVEGQKGP